MRLYWRQFACYSFVLTLLGVHVLFQYAVVPNAGGFAADWAPGETGGAATDLAAACEQWIGRRSLKVPKGYPEVEEGGESHTEQEARMTGRGGAGDVGGAWGHAAGAAAADGRGNDLESEEERATTTTTATIIASRRETDANSPSWVGRGLEPPPRGAGDGGPAQWHHLLKNTGGENPNHRTVIAAPQLINDAQSSPGTTSDNTLISWATTATIAPLKGLGIHLAKERSGRTGDGAGTGNKAGPGRRPSHPGGAWDDDTRRAGQGLPGHFRPVVAMPPPRDGASSSQNLHPNPLKIQPIRQWSAQDSGHPNEAVPRVLDHHAVGAGNDALVVKAAQTGATEASSKGEQLGGRTRLPQRHDGAMTNTPQLVGLAADGLHLRNAGGAAGADTNANNPHHQRYAFTCSNINRINIKRKLGQGVTKQVYLGVHEGRKVAVKMVTRNVIDVVSCMKRLRREAAELDPTASLPSEEKHRCYTLPNMKLMKEILLLNQLDHPNLLRLKGYCVRSEETEATSLQEHGIVAVYEYGLRFYVSNLRDWPWPLRLRTALELADLLEYLQLSPLGSLRVSDFKDAHFLLKDGRIKLTDMDDVTSLEPSCQPNAAPELDLRAMRAPPIAPKASRECGYGLRCIAGMCPGYNAMKNMDNFNRLFFSNLLIGDSPETEEQMLRLRTRLDSLSLSATELKRILYRFLDVPYLPGYS